MKFSMSVCSLLFLALLSLTPKSSSAATVFLGIDRTESGAGCIKVTWNNTVTFSAADANYDWDYATINIDGADISTSLRHDMGTGTYAIIIYAVNGTTQTFATYFKDGLFDGTDEFEVNTNTVYNTVHP